MLNRFYTAAIAAGLAFGWLSSAQADPTSQEEVDRQFPLPRAFNPRDVLIARTIAERAKAVLDESLLDYQTARFKSVRAVFHADWRSWERDYYLCGEMNVRNRMGAYTGWREFVITGQPDKRPAFIYVGQTGAILLIATVCHRGRDDRYVSDKSEDYAKLIAAR